jgi:sugar lactone lactonase YvrE
VRASRQAAAGVLIIAVCAGFFVASSRPLAVHAFVPAPGTISTYAGGPGSGTATQIAQAPWGLSAMGSTLYVSDSDHAVARALDTGTGVETIVAGNGGPGARGDGGQATAASLDPPTGIGVDPLGNVYIASFFRVRRVDHTNGAISTFAGTGVPGFSGDGGQATAATLNGVSGLAVDASGDVYISDSNRIRKIDHSTGIINTIAGTGMQGWVDGPAATAQFNLPYGIAVDGSGNVWIADLFNNRIRELSGGVVSTVVGDGQGSFGGDGGPALSAHLNGPRGVWLDSSGNVWIADTYNSRIREVVSGTINTVAGNGNSGSTGDGGPATSAELNLPLSVIKVGSDFYIAETAGKRVRKVSGGTITTAAGTGAICSRSGDGAAATAATLCSPQGAAVDATGNLFIADTANNIVRKVTPGGVISTVAGTGAQGSSGDGGPATAAQLNGPRGVALDASGDLFIADTNNDVVREVSGGTITRVAGTIGSPGLAGDGGAAVSALLNSPTALAVNSGGAVFVADAGNSRIRKFTPGGNIATFAGSGFGFSGDGGPATAADLSNPQGIAVDGSGNVYIADTGNSKIRKVDNAGTITSVASISSSGVAVGPAGRVIAASSSPSSLVVEVTPSGPQPIAGTGAHAYSGDGGPATLAELLYPSAVAVDASGDIFIVTAVIRRVQAFATPSAPLAVSGAPGDNSVTVRWSPPADTGGLPVLTYTVTPSAGPPQMVATTMAHFSRLANGTPYTFTVTATTAWATGPPSAPSAPVTPTYAPRGVIVTHAGTAGVGPALSIAQWPLGLGLGPNDGGHLYVGDLQNGVVRDILISTGNETVLAGASSFGYSGDGAQAVNAQMLDAGAVITCGDSTYFTDTDNSVVRKVSANGIITTVAGTGVAGYSGDGGPATSARLHTPFGLACGDPNLWPNSPILFIADSYNGVIRSVSNTGIIDTLWCTTSTLYFPTGLAKNGNGFLDVADFGANRVVQITPSCSVSFLAGTGVQGSSGDGGPALSATLNGPYAVVDNGGLYISDSGNNKIRFVNLAGNISTFAGTGVAGFSGDGGSPTAARLNTPYGLTTAYDHDGHAALFVADSLNYRVREVRLDGSSITTVAGNGTLSLSGDGGPAQDAQLANPFAIAIDAAGRLYVADLGNSSIRMIQPDGTISTIAGTGVAGYFGDGGPASSAKLYLPFGVAIDPLGDIVISDGGNNRIRKVDHITGQITPIAGTGTAGFSGDGLSAMTAQLNQPFGIVVAGDGTIYFSDRNNNRVRKIAGGNISTIAGNGVAGYSGDGQQATVAELNHPRGLALDGAGNLLIADGGNSRVRKVALATGVITTVAGNGQFGVAGDRGQATAASLEVPSGVAVDSGGNLFIADVAANRVRMVDVLGVISTPIAACGVLARFSGDNGLAAIATLNTPEGVAVDGEGNVLIADNNNNRLRVAGPLIGVRGAACQGPESVPGTRSAQQSGPGAPGPRLPEEDSPGGARTPGGLLAARLVDRPVASARDSTTATRPAPGQSGVAPSGAASGPGQRAQGSSMGRGRLAAKSGLGSPESPARLPQPLIGGLVGILVLAFFVIRLKRYRRQ